MAPDVANLLRRKARLQTLRRDWQPGMRVALRNWTGTRGVVLVVGDDELVRVAWDAGEVSAARPDKLVEIG